MIFNNEKLVAEIQQGGGDLGQLYFQNLPVIRLICQRLEPDRNALDDALQDAFFGLYEAVKRFDADKGAKFITFAKFWIADAVRRGRFKRMERRSGEAVHFEALRVLSAARQFENEHGREPSVSEHAKALDLDEKRVRYLLWTVTPPESLDAPLKRDSSEGDRFTLGDTIPAPDSDFAAAYADREVLQQIQSAARAAVDALSERRRYAVKRRYFDGATLSEIAAELGISDERVRQLIKDGLTALSKSDLAAVIDHITDRETDYFVRSGVNGFNQTWTSATEAAALKRIETRDRAERRLYLDRQAE